VNLGFIRNYNGVFNACAIQGCNEELGRHCILGGLLEPDLSSYTLENDAAAQSYTKCSCSCNKRSCDKTSTITGNFF
jgi:hypothetical protein